jgi:kynureninase
MDDLEPYRNEFPILAKTIYMISNSLGPMPRRAAQQPRRVRRNMGDAWRVRAWEERWWKMPGEVGNRIAWTIGAPYGTVSMHQNVTTAHMVALSTLRPTATRRRLVCSAMDFPSMIHLFRGQQAAGFELNMVDAEPDLSIATEKMLDAIDETTALVAFSHVLFRTAYIMDAAAIIERAHRAGARVILDTYQSAGIVPLDVSALQVDFAVGGCLKWLCGGPGSAFMYTRPDVLRTASPRFTGWLSHRSPFEFDTRVLQPRDDGMRMMD